MHFEMGKLVVSRSSVVSCFVFLVLMLLYGKVAGRVHYDNNDELLVSDGITIVSDHEEDYGDHLKGMGMGMGMGEGKNSSSSSSSSSCHEMYGFLPCSTSILGHMFVVGIYDYLLYRGDSLVTHDARDLLFGKGYWGAVFFQLLDSFPEPLVLAASVGLSKDEAVEEHLAIAVGLLVGSPILFLTLVWGCCILAGSRKFDFEEIISTNNIHRLRQLFTGSGVITDTKTSLRARFMLVSLIPFIVILIPMAVGVSSAYQHFVLLLALLATFLCLFSFFFWQHVNPSILETTTEYTRNDRKMEMRVPFYEVQELMRHRNKHLMSMGIEMEKNMKTYIDHNNMIIKDGVPVTFKDWFFQKIKAMEDPNHHTNFNKVAQLLFEEKISLIKVLIEGMVPHDILYDNDEIQRKLAIDRLFQQLDMDGSSSISPSELRRFLDSKQHDRTVDEEVIEIIMSHLDVDGDGNIDPEEFKIGMTAWLWEIEQHYNHETDYDGVNEAIRDKNSISAIFFLILGISILTLFAEPLTHSVQIFSESVNFSPLYISLIFLPMARHYRTAFGAIEAARKKRHHMTSSTFSEIYHKVLMNNLMGFSLLLCVMIYRGLTWHFSAEVLTLVIVCGVVGILTGFNSKFPNWTLLIAFPLYPLSLIFFILVNNHFR